jgi:hypothetical protein
MNTKMHPSSSYVSEGLHRLERKLISEAILTQSTDDFEKLKTAEIIRETYKLPQRYTRPVEKTLQMLMSDLGDSDMWNAGDYDVEKALLNRYDFTMYKLLGISAEASLAEIKKAYRQISLLLHPGNFCNE